MQMRSFEQMAEHTVRQRRELRQMNILIGVAVLCLAGGFTLALTGQTAPSIGLIAIGAGCQARIMILTDRARQRLRVWYRDRRVRRARAGLPVG